ncbi:hypothetical protein BLA29_010577 [Euroglyphus maynei]|uniref:Uncharacterized protein n=1 Tax=Euroglyphus maynei TaxID=6958 RepID=A0A1Y3BKM7_EURMA|nr:hypothetical protein BLA29_010577 [Euroglyphus maynei]
MYQFRCIRIMYTAL